MLFTLIILAVAIMMYYYNSRPEKYTLDDPKYDTTLYTEAEAVVDHDLMEKLVLATNEEIIRRADDCSYIIETTAIERFVKDGSPDVYKCMFMCVRAKGFAYGFSVVSTLSVRGDDVRVLSLRTQPMYVDPPSDVRPYVQDVAKEFLDFELVKEKATPTVGELDAAKENLR
jgi:hypothetical protein